MRKQDAPNFDKFLGITNTLKDFINYCHNDLKLNSWGPFVSWRQPVWREWFYVQGDLNYLNDRREDRSHVPSALVRLEALF